MVAVSHRFELVYFPIPKNATSSLKHVFYTIETGHPFDAKTRDRLGGTVHQFYRSRPSDWLDYYAGYTSFVIVRDPIKRLLSAYGNRVLGAGESRSEKLSSAGLKPEPTIEEFIINFNEYRENSKVIRNHTIPQSRYVGDFWDKIALKIPIEQLGSVPEMLQKLTGARVELPQMKKTPNPAKVSDLSPKLFNKLVDFYQKDYEMLGPMYSPDMLK
ncbi:sulfotransferase family 2 domain-containing protein [Bauldia sp.]|uniref:sulfotransferase family 2 domain-containing protein n=1 Tax=Bauldia sp. TaxID=2575872 RepID=UPI003BABBA4D